MILYILWIALTGIISLYGMSLYLPYEEDDMFPLFHDIFVLLFLYPSYFLFTFGTIPQIILNFKNKR